MSNDFNKELITIYKSLMEKYVKIPSHSKEIINERWYKKEEIVGKDILTFPYLLQVNNNFLKSEKRIVIFGQESYGWGDKEFRFWGDFIDFSCLPEAARKKLKLFPSIIGGNNELDCVESLIMCLMALYNWKDLDDFGCDGSIYKNFYKFLKEHCTSQGFSIIRNNLAKIGYKYGNEGNNTPLNLQFLEFIIQELELLNPKLLIFLTGPQPQYIKLMSTLLSYFNEKIDESCLTENKPNYDNPVKEVSLITIKGNHVRILWSYHPNGASRQGVLSILKKQYAKLIR